MNPHPSVPFTDTVRDIFLQFHSIYSFLYSFLSWYPLQNPSNFNLQKCLSLLILIIPHSSAYCTNYLMTHNYPALKSPFLYSLNYVSLLPPCL